MDSQWIHLPVTGYAMGLDPMAVPPITGYTMGVMPIAVPATADNRADEQRQNRQPTRHQAGTRAARRAEPDDAERRPTMNVMEMMSHALAQEQTVVAPAAPARSYDNPVTGEHVTFLATADETDGAFVKIRQELPAGAAGVPCHYHLTYAETFTVLQGQLDVCVGGKRNHRVLRPGDVVHVPVRTPHRFWNSSDQPVVFTTEVRPARRFEQAMRAAGGLARAGKINAAGLPTNLWEAALIYELSESYIAGLPLALQRGLFGLLARLARRLGYDPALAQYAGSQ